MRKIETELTQTFRSHIKYPGGMRTDRNLTKRDTIMVDRFGEVSYLLWDSPIVKYNQAGTMHLSDCGGHTTSTTKSRLNAFLDAFYPGVARIYQKDWTLYISYGPCRWTTCSEPWEGSFNFEVRVAGGAK